MKLGYLINEIGNNDATCGRLRFDDGAQDWDCANLIDALPEEELECEATTDENGNICMVDDDGYIVTPPAYRVKYAE